LESVVGDPQTAPEYAALFPGYTLGLGRRVQPELREGPLNYEPSRASSYLGARGMTLLTRVPWHADPTQQ